jgi:hypothetical protein
MLGAEIGECRRWELLHAYRHVEEEEEEEPCFFPVKVKGFGNFSVNRMG